jgi:hypothetical protein
LIFAQLWISCLSTKTHFDKVIDNFYTKY